MVVFIAFSLLVGATALAPLMPAQVRTSKSTAHPYHSKPYRDWILDGAGLFVQGVLIPLLQVTVIYRLWALLLPQTSGSLYVGLIPSLVVSFVGVDYLYYWNHRWLHCPRFWAIHRVHHTVTQMDVLGTSRNTLWSSFFIVYLWVHGLMIYLLHDPTGYILGVSLTSALDLWRHSSLMPPAQSRIYRLLSSWLIMPQDHARHHQSLKAQTIPGDEGDRPAPPCNFGANLNLWDRLHRTYQPSRHAPKTLGNKTHLSLARQLLFPFDW